MTELYAEDVPFFSELRLNPKQSEFVTDTTTFILGSGGKGGGKTVGLNAKTIGLLTNSSLFGNMAGNVGCIGRFREKDLRNTTLKELWNWMPRSWIRKENKDEGWIELLNESVLFTTHFDDITHITSFNLGFAAIDQMEEIPLDVFNELAYNRIRLRVLKRFRSGVRDKVLVQPKFSNIYPYDCISTDPEELESVLRFQTVFGMANPKPSPLYYKFIKNEEYRVSKDPGVHKLYNPDFKLIEISTTENAKWLPKDYIERQRRDKTKRAFERDVLGQMNSFEGVVYLDFTDDLINEQNIIPHPNWPIYIGIDHGGTGQDESKATGVTGIIFTAIEPRIGDWPIVHIFDELYLQGSTIEETINALYDKLLAIGTAQRFHYPDIVPNIPDVIPTVRAYRCDPSMSRGIQDANETIMMRYMRYAKTIGLRLPLAPGDNKIAENIERVSWLFRKKLTRVNPKCHNFIEEHRTWMYGNNEKPKPMQRDHLCNSLGYVSSAYSFVHKRLDLPPKEPTGFEMRQRKQAELYRQDLSDPVYGDRFAS